ncbi:MAG: carboxypeptidase regulatory-like domain-containing protein [Bryobacterales bacterium]|nr:carboxypeptidase regulatory-like domain-containing protein [Bryobacterales bacterium]MBV9400633.1 carboxypeptidase regulatory-like domain-containing protein [Bryobacterales bacterium]
MYRSKNSRQVITGLITLLLCVSFAAAQSTFGSFVGSVRDPSGAVIADCIVTVTNTGTGVKRSVVTDKEGSYSIVNLEPGMYEIVLEAPGFQPLMLKNLSLLARETLRADGALVVAGQVQTVDVTSTNVAVITTEVSNIAETKSGRELVDLPVAIGSRALGSTSAISTLTTQSGVQTDGAGALSVAGTKPSQLSITIDGISTMSVRSEAPIAELFPSFGTIEEIRVSQINNAAEFGGVSDITTISKSGTNSLHGGVYENLQNTDMNARNPFSATVSQIHMNNYGGYLGGPVVLPRLYHGKDKTFFFMSYEGLQLPRQQFIVQSVPSLALRSGDLSVYKLGQIPLSQISPVSLAALNYLFPLPNTGPANAIANNYAVNFPTPISSNQADARIDQVITPKQTLFVRGTYKYKDITNPPSSTGTILAGGTHQPEMDYAFTGAHNWVISPTVVNELRVGITATRVITSTGINATAITSAIGVPLPDPPVGSATPTFTITGFQSTSSTASSVSRSQTKQLIDNITWTKGSHSYKFGGDIRRLSAYFSNVFAGNRAGQYTFNGSVTGLNPYQAFLLGIPDRTGVGIVDAPDSNGSAVHYAVFAQDDWKVSPFLTVNYGMRWEYHPPFTDAWNNMAVFLPDSYSIVNGVTVHGAVAVSNHAPVDSVFAGSIAPTPILSAGQAGLPNTLHYSDKTSFGPRIGFAWRPFRNDKTVIRGGYGRFIEAMLGTLTSAGWAVQSSSVGSYTNTIVGGTPALTLANPFPANLSQPGTQSFQLSADVHYHDPYVQQWNLTIERALGFNTGLRLTYDGNHGSDIGYTQNLAQVAPNTIGFAKAAAGSAYPLWAYIAQESTGARSNYNAFTVAANKRMSHGLQFASSYTFAKNLSNGQGYNPTAFATQAGGTVTDIYNLNLDYGNVSFTHRNRFLTTFLYEMPFGHNRMLFGNANGFMDALIGGWELSGVLLFQTGPFLTVIAPGADPSGNNSVNTSGAGRADIVSGIPLYPANQGIGGWINPAAFVKPANNIGRPGDSPVGAVVGPGTQAVSLSLFKSFQVKERMKIQIGAAASNAINHPNYAVPSNLSIGTAGFSSLNNVQSQENGGPRSIQVTGRLSF